MVKKYTALKPLRMAAGRPEYLNSVSSLSVSTPALTQRRENRNMLNNPPSAAFHQNQFRHMPSLRTYSVIARGVSEAKVVATMEVPSSHQGRFLPERKYSPTSLLARREKYTPIPRERAR